MKNKLLKIGKPMISLVVAFAVVAVSLFAALPGINLNIFAATVTDTWDGTKASAFERGTGTESDPYMIATAEQLAYAVFGDKSVSEDKYFKVVDDAVFNMNGMQDITLDSTVGDVKLATATGVGTWTTDAQTFAGNFDGNGVVIYNLYSVGGYAGLFPYITTDNTAKTCSFKNITVANSYISGYHFSGGIIGNSYATGTSQYMNVENCMVKNCYISDNGNTNINCNRTSGTMVGCAAHNKTTIKNCFALDNITSATNITGGFIGNTSAFAGDAVISSCISIGTLPYSVASSDSSKALETKSTAPGCYSNVYTDQDADAAYASVITKVSADNMVGAAAKANMPSLDWTTFIAFDGDYPDYRSNHTLNTVSNGESGHSTSCSDCGKTLTETHNFVEDVDALLNKCDCGYTTPITQIKDTWDGTQDANLSGAGTERDPYIISTAEQMAYVALSSSLNSSGKYFKVADYCVFNMNGMMGITEQSTAAEVKAATKNNGYNWKSDSATFAGNFDGNGVIIYNLYSNAAYAGLFPNMNTNNDPLACTIKNVTVKASCFIGYHYAGGIVGLATASTTSQKLNFNNCATINCYLTDNNNANSACNRTTGTIAGAVAHNGVTVENCLAKGNLLESTDIKGGFIGNTSAFSPNVNIVNSVSIGTLPYSTLTAGSPRVLQAKAIAADGYKNVYTDQPADLSTYTDMVILTVGQMSGVAAIQNMELDFSSIWFANNGIVELQISHNLSGLADPSDNYAGHVPNCKNCDISGVVVVNHTYDSDYTCTSCGFVCDHQNEDYLTVEEDLVGDCVTAPNTATICACGHVDRDEHGVAEGHKLVKTDAVENNCGVDGNLAYWTCEECGNIFLTDDKMAAMDTAVFEEDVMLKATGDHVVLKDSNGDIVYGMDAESHWMNCEVCKCKLEAAAHSIEYDSIEGGATNCHSEKCTVCLYETSEAEHKIEVDEESYEGVYKWCEDEDGFGCDYTAFDYSVANEDLTVTVTATTNAFTKDVITDIFSVTEGEPGYEEVSKVLTDAGHISFAAYEISPSEEMAQGGKATIVMRVPDIFGTNAAIYLVDVKTGKVEKLATTVETVTDPEDENNEIIVATVVTDRLGYVAVGSSNVKSVDGVNDSNVDSNTGNQGGVNGDSSLTSPATSDNWAHIVLITAILAGATVLFLRKVRV